jgi:aminopeptidase 2
MLMGVVGEAKFFEGVSIYLKKHLYGNAQSSDLWEGISKAAGKDMGTVMADWTRKVGFPVLTVEELGGGEIKVTQNRFLSTGDVKPEEDETIWWVPLEIKTVEREVQVDHGAILDSRSTTLKVASDAFKLNGETIGFYRVKYSPERLAKIGTHAQSFSINDRIGLLSDASALASAGYSRASEALTFATAVAAKETEYLPLDMIASLLGKVAQVWWEDEGVRSAIDALRNRIFRPVLDQLGYEDAAADSPGTRELRALAVSTCAAAREASVLVELGARFRPLLASGDDSRIPPDLQREIFTAAIADGGEAEYAKVLEVYASPLSNPSTKVDAMMALCATRADALLDRTFAMLADPKAIKDQDVSTVSCRT